MFSVYTIDDVDGMASRLYLNLSEKWSTIECQEIVWLAKLLRTARFHYFIKSKPQKSFEAHHHSGHFSSSHQIKRRSVDVRGSHFLLFVYTSLSLQIHHEGIKDEGIKDDLINFPFGAANVGRSLGPDVTW